MVTTYRASGALQNPAYRSTGDFLSIAASAAGRHSKRTVPHGPRQAGAVELPFNHWYAPRKQVGSESVKRVNLLNYFHLAETLQSAKQTMTPDVVKGGHMYFSAMDVRSKIDSFL